MVTITLVHQNMQGINNKKELQIELLLKELDVTIFCVMSESWLKDIEVP